MTNMKALKKVQRNIGNIGLKIYSTDYHSRGSLPDLLEVIIDKHSNGRSPEVVHSDIKNKLLCYIAAFYGAVKLVKVKRYGTLNTGEWSYKAILREDN